MRSTLLAAAFAVLVPGAAAVAVLVPGAAAVALLAQDTASKPVVEVYKSPT